MSRLLGESPFREISRTFAGSPVLSPHVEISVSAGFIEQGVEVEVALPGFDVNGGVKVGQFQQSKSGPKPHPIRQDAVHKLYRVNAIENLAIRVLAHF